MSASALYGYYIGGHYYSTANPDTVPHDEQCEGDWDPESRSWTECECMQRLREVRK